MRTLAGAVFCAIVVATGPLARAEALAPAKPEEVGLSPDRLARIGKVFGQEIDQGRLPGVVVAIARKGKLAYYESFGFRDKAAGAPMPKDAIFRIYSMTKPLASVGAATLMEEGRLQLTDPVAKWLPEFANLQVSEMRTDVWGKVSYALVPAEHPPTVQDLLRHSAGLAYGELTGNAAVKDAYTKAGVYKSGIDYEARDLAPAEEVERLAKAPLAHQPGTAWEYSLAVDVLGRVVEKVSGQRLGDLLQQRLLAPLGMVDTGFGGAAREGGARGRAAAERPGHRRPEPDDRRLEGAGERLGRGRGRLDRARLPAVRRDDAGGTASSTGPGS